MKNVRFTLLTFLLTSLAFYLVMGAWWWIVDIQIRGIEPTKSVAPIILLGHIAYTMLSLAIYGVALAMFWLVKKLTKERGQSPYIELHPF